MGKGIDFSLDLGSDLKQAEAFLNQFKTKDVVQAARRAINRTALGLRQKSLDDIRKRINAKEKTLRQRMRVHNAQGNSLASLNGGVSYSPNGIPMIEFVKGSKGVIQQKGIAVKRRRKIKAEVVKGKTFVVKKAFIQKATTVQLFKGRRKEGFKKQGIISLGELVANRGYGERFQTYAGRRFQREFLRELNIRASGIVKSK